MELLNEAVEFPIAGQMVKLRKIGTIKRRAIIQSWYIELLISEIRDKAKAAFESADERIKYMREQMDKIPSGQALQDVIDDLKVGHQLPMRLLVEASGKTEIELEGMVRDSTVEEYQAVIDFLFAFNLKKK